MAKMLGKLILWIAAGVLLCVMLFLVWPIGDALRDQVTVYPVTRIEVGRLLPLNRSVYQVFRETQTVIHWMPGISEVPDRLAKCSVRDRFHWRCEYTDGSGVLTMDGRRFESRPTSNVVPSDITYITRLRWYALHLSWMR